jgi:hypothetical protein
MAKHGKVADMVVCENAGLHLAGNTYIKFEDEEQAAVAMAAVQGRFYAGRPLQAEYTPVTDFWEGVCKQLEKEGVCGRSLQCNFMHLKKIGPDLERDLYPDGRGQSRGYSGGAYGRSERAGFEQRSSYDRGTFRVEQKRNWNDRRHYDRREHDQHQQLPQQPPPFDHYRGPPPPPHDYRNQGPPPPRYHDRGPPPPPFFDDPLAPPPPPFDHYRGPPPPPHDHYRGPPPPHEFYAEPPRHRHRSRSPVRHHGN